MVMREALGPPVSAMMEVEVSVNCIVIASSELWGIVKVNSDSKQGL
jgi:hypothetical protein